MEGWIGRRFDQGVDEGAPLLTGGTSDEDSPDTGHIEFLGGKLIVTRLILSPLVGVVLSNTVVAEAISNMIKDLMISSFNVDH
jgi:hypothetical protein